MPKVPFKLNVERLKPNRHIESITCVKLLRVIPDSRHVYDALWNQKNVIVKIFSHKINAKRHLNREYNGLKKLQSRNLNVPQPLFVGQTCQNDWAVITEKIANGVTTLDIFNGTDEKQKRFELLSQVCKELAAQHERGVLQKDLHLDNFILLEDKVFTIDPAQIQFFNKPICRKKSISQLALLLLYWPQEDNDTILKLAGQYASVRKWQLQDSDYIFLQKQLIIQRKKIIRRGLKKYLRTSKRTLKVKSPEFTTVFKKDFCLQIQPLDFINQIDFLMDKGHILKRGNTSYVSKVTLNGKDIVIKRYNYKGIIHSLRHTIKRSRARRGWLLTNRLQMLNIPSPKPFAFIERRKFKIIWKSYIINEYLEGQNLYDLIHDDHVTEGNKVDILSEVQKLIEKLYQYDISHGDLKMTNIIVTDKGPTFLDLDAMRVHISRLLLKLQKNKDISRLKRNIPEFLLDKIE